MPTSTPEAFSTVAKQDYLKLFEGIEPKYQDVMKVMEFKKQDVARATGVAVSSVRWEDDKVPAAVRERFREWANLMNLVAEFFEGDARKTFLWFTIRNPMLGNIAPRDMIRFGRYNRLKKFIENALSENRR